MGSIAGSPRCVFTLRVDPIWIVRELADDRALVRVASVPFRWRDRSVGRSRGRRGRGSRASLSPARRRWARPLTLAKKRSESRYRGNVREISCRTNGCLTLHAAIRSFGHDVLSRLGKGSGCPDSLAASSRCSTEDAPPKRLGKRVMRVEALKSTGARPLSKRTVRIAKLSVRLRTRNDP